jgi:acyl carrier protein
MKTFNQITEEILHIKEADIKDELSPSDIPDWDSMNYLLFIAELEKEFSMSFTMDEVMNAKTLGDVRAIVNRTTQ